MKNTEKEKSAHGAKRSTLLPGKYRHYKGNEYEGIGVAKHSETGEEFIVYRALHGDHGLYIRPYEMFVEEVEVDGKRMPRFEYIGNKERQEKCA